MTRGLDTLDIEKVYGSGNYGVVYKVRDRSNHNCLVALKKIKTDRETQGFPITALREIKILNMLKHENIVDLKEIVTCNIDESDSKARLYRDKGIFPGDVFMLFEFVDYDLSGLLKAKYELSQDMIRSYMHQLLSGIKFLHDNRVIHRDLKCANILITSNHGLKIADWGLARIMPTQAQNMTVPVVTLWYRSPELILERRDYGVEIDIWSAG
jgi:serine/threonine protein kinase